MIPYNVNDWRKTAEERRSKITFPKEWMVDSKYLEDINEKSTRSVLEVPKQCGILNDKELEITEMKATELLQRLKSSELTSYEVTLSFCKRAAIAHQLTNCLTELFFEEALEHAKDLDETIKKSGPIGRLHGLPVSFKELFNMANHETTFGFVSWVGNIKNEDGLVVKCIKSAGGVPFCKTNLAQGCLIVEGMNNLFGTCLNPNNLSLTPSGSSSGEAALVKLKGSPLGIGTDGGGSVRLPAHSNGIYGFIPSTNRITSLGIGEGKGGLTWVQPQIGPLVSDVDAIEVWYKAMVDYNMGNFDSFVYNVGYSPIEKPSTIKFGVFYQDNVVETTPAMLRVLKNTVMKLRNSGYEVIEIDIGDLHRKLTEVVFQMYVSSGLQMYRKSVEASGEPYVPRCCGSKYTPTMSLDEVYGLDQQARILADSYLQLFVSNQLDVLLTPSSPNPPAPHGKYSTNSLSAVYNCLGYAAGVVPMGTVNPEVDSPKDDYFNSAIMPDLSVTEIFPYDYYDKYVKTELYNDIEKFRNAPLSIQVVGRKMSDEYVIEAMKIISKLK